MSFLMVERMPRRTSGRTSVHEGSLVGSEAGLQLAVDSLHHSVACWMVACSPSSVAAQEALQL